MKLKPFTELLNRPTGKLMTGSLGGYAILLVLAPVLTRLYSPEVFGQFSVFSSVVAIASVCFSLSLELGILSARKRPEALQFARLATLVIGLFALASLVLLGAASLAGLEWQLPAWATALAIVACAVAGFTSVSVNWNIYTGKTATAAHAVFTGLSARSVLQAGLGYAYGGLAGLVIGELAGRLLSLSVSLEHRLRAAVRTLFDRRSLARIDRRAMRPYALFVTPAAALDVALVWLPAPLFALLFGPLAGGLVAMVQRLASVPLTVANQSIGQVFHRKVASMIGKNNRGLLRFMAIYGLVLSAAAAGAVFIILYYGSTLFGFLLGKEWSKMSLAAIAMTPLYLSQFMALLTNRVLIVAGRANFKLATSAAQLGVLVATAFLASEFALSWEIALFWVACSLALTQCVSILYVLSVLMRRPSLPHGPRPNH